MSLVVPLFSAFCVSSLYYSTVNVHRWIVTCPLCNATQCSLLSELWNTEYNTLHYGWCGGRVDCTGTSLYTYTDCSLWTQQYWPSSSPRPCHHHLSLSYCQFLLTHHSISSYKQIFCVLTSPQARGLHSWKQVALSFTHVPIFSLICIYNLLCLSIQLFC